MPGVAAPSPVNRENPACAGTAPFFPENAIFKIGTYFWYISLFYS
jgi:hypothetical protein